MARRHSGSVTTTRAFGIAIAIVFALIRTTPALAESTVHDYWERLNELTKTQSWEEGSVLLIEATRRFPNEVGFHCWLNFTLRVTGRLEEALEQISSASQLFPAEDCVVESHVASLLELGWEIYETENQSRSLALFETAWRIDPDDEWVQNAYGSFLRDTGQLESSIALFDSALEKFPENTYLRDNFVYALTLAGDRHRDERDLFPAIDMYERARSLSPENEWIYLSLGNAQRMAGNFDEARAHFEHLLSVSPRNEFVVGNLIATFIDIERSEFKDGEIESAIETIQTALSRFPGEIWLLSDLVEYSVVAGDVDAAVVALTELADPRLVREYGNPVSVPDESLHQKLDPIVLKLAGQGRFEDAKLLIERIDHSHLDSFFVEHAKGRVDYFAGEIEEGIEHVYRAYDQLVFDRPEYLEEVVIGLPLKGTFLVYGNSSLKTITHAGLHRYSYDFMGSEPDGSLRNDAGPGLGANEDYIGFGSPIYAPVDGVVELVEDGHPDIAPTETLVLRDGNSIGIVDGKGRHYFFTHNRMGSARVRVGDHVKKGTVIAELGNSGYTGVPHLHFAVYSADWLVSLPVRFDRYFVVGADGSSREVRNGSPATGEVVHID